MNFTAGHTIHVTKHFSVFSSTFFLVVVCLVAEKHSVNSLSLNIYKNKNKKNYMNVIFGNIFALWSLILVFAIDRDEKKSFVCPWRTQFLFTFHHDREEKKKKKEEITVSKISILNRLRIVSRLLIQSQSIFKSLFHFRQLFFFFSIYPRDEMREMSNNKKKQSKR